MTATLIAAGGALVPATAASAADPLPITVANSATTGIPAGKTFKKVHNGNLVIKYANTVIDGWDIRGTVRIDAPGAIIKNSRITGGANPGTAGLVQNVASGAQFTIVDSEIYATTQTPYANGIFGSNFTAKRNDIHHVVDPIRVLNSNTYIYDNWLHDNLHFTSDPVQNGGPSHDDSIQIQGGKNHNISGNRISGSHNAAIQIVQDKSRPRVEGILLSKNYLDGGGCTLNVAPGYFTRINITGNVFGPNRVHKGCGIITGNNTLPAMTSNIWDATRTKVGYVPR
ncbi:MAG: right-handed parallel beta-helix repeat-containing protein [Leifsonia flava]